MDFTQPLAHSRAHAFTYSPDGRFLAYIAALADKPDLSSSAARARPPSTRSTLLVRSADTLQVLRAWDVEVSFTSTEWSFDGRYILAVAPSKETGTACVFALDAQLEADDGSDGAQGWVARIDTGIEGLVGGQWAPGSYAVVLFSQFDLHATFYSLTGLTIDVVQDVKLPRLLACAAFPSLVALVRRRGGSESIILLRALSQSEWVVEHSFPLGTVDAAAASWSPDGKFLAVWDYAAEFRLLVCTPLGYLRFAYMTAPDAVRPALLPLAPSISTNAPAASRPGKVAVKQAPNSSASSELTTAGPPTRAQRVVQAPRAVSGTVRTPNSRDSGGGGDAGSVLPKHTGGGLGIRRAAWCPTGEVLAIGSYDEKIHLLDPPTGTTVAILDLSRTVISHEYTHFRPRNAGGLFPYGRLGIWREPPLTWLQQNEDTIVPFSHASRSAKGKLSPETVMSIRPDNLLPGTETSPRGGIIALAWNGSGTLLASQNECMPTTVFVHALNNIVPGTTQPYLLAAILCGSTVKAVRWQPRHESGAHAGHEALYVTSGQGAISIWTLRPDQSARSFTQMAEGIPVPGGVRVDQATWSPRGTGCVLADASTFCMGIVP